ncbi:MAG: hypothetical protein ACYDCG_06850 [Candidatus Acidiferrales bacterium]
MNAKEIGRMTKMMVLAGLCMLGAMLPQAKADEWNQKTIFTFSGPVEIPGKVLPAGTYVFKLADSESDRNIVQVFSKDQRHLYGTFLAIPDYRMKPTGKTVITFDECAANSPEAVKAWFYPGDNYGQEFVYPKTRALQLAKANNTPVASMPDELAANTTKPATTMKEPSVMAMKTAPLMAEKPTEEVAIAEVFATPPPSARLPKKLPKTASQLPLIALVGLLSLGMAAVLRFAAAKTQ